MLQILLILQGYCPCFSNLMIQGKEILNPVASQICGLLKNWTLALKCSHSEVVYIMSAYIPLAEDRLKFIPILKGSRSTILCFLEENHLNIATPAMLTWS